MPSDYYDKIFALLKNLVDDEGVSIPEILKLVDAGENNANITRPWLYSVYNQTISDPGVKRIDALYRVLRKKKQKLQRLANGK